VLKTYLAAPLFSDAERAYNLVVANALAEHVSVFLPQRDGKLITDLIGDGLTAAAAKRVVFERDVSAIEDADLIVAILDGRAVDEGVAVELGLAYAMGKLCWSLKTDFRSLAWFGDNPMIEMVIARNFKSIESLAVSVRDLAHSKWAPSRATG
jgi:nucleoside 2-deoxyribosyltransferase